MATTTNKRKTNELKAYSVARWNGQPLHPDYGEYEAWMSDKEMKESDIPYCEFHCDEIL